MGGLLMIRNAQRALGSRQLAFGSRQLAILNPQFSFPPNLVITKKMPIFALFFINLILKYYECLDGRMFQKV
jgi:hypothetical protein